MHIKKPTTVSSRGFLLKSRLCATNTFGVVVQDDYDAYYYHLQRSSSHYANQIR